MSKRNRLSFPFFFDPSFDAEILPIEGLEHRVLDDSRERWDRASVHEFSGNYVLLLVHVENNARFPHARGQAIPITQERIATATERELLFHYLAYSKSRIARRYF